MVARMLRRSKCALLCLAASSLMSAQNTPKPHVPSVRIFDFPCKSVRLAAQKYFDSRGIVLEPYSRKRQKQACPGSECSNLSLDKLRDSAGHRMSADEVKSRYTQPFEFGGTPEYRNKTAWTEGQGFWVSARDWRAGGYFETQNKPTGCLVRVDFGYGRGITEFWFVIPYDYWDDSFFSNDQFEAEVVSGIEATLKNPN
jgi:hypothetical protein